MDPWTTSKDALEELRKVKMPAPGLEKEAANELIERSADFVFVLSHIGRWSLVDDGQGFLEKSTGPGSEFDLARVKAIAAVKRIDIASSGNHPFGHGAERTPRSINEEIKAMLVRLDGDHYNLFWPLEKAYDDVDRVLKNNIREDIRSDLQSWRGQLRMLLTEDSFRHVRGSALLLWCYESSSGDCGIQRLGERLRQLFLQDFRKFREIISCAAKFALKKAKHSERVRKRCAIIAQPTISSLRKSLTPSAMKCEPITASVIAEPTISSLRSLTPSAMKCEQKTASVIAQPTTSPLRRSLTPSAMKWEPITAAERDRLIQIKEEIDPNGTYIGESVPILRVFEQIKELNSVSNRSTSKIIPVLLLGPTGAGKTEIARLIHISSGRTGKFVVEQAADLVGGDLHLPRSRWIGIGTNSGLPNVDKKGYPGKLCEAKGGTIFLDELADVPWDFQTLLLKILDGCQIPLPAGQGDPITPSVRMIFAMNVDPDEAVTNGKLRHDLLRRLRKWIIGIPPLNERIEDVLLFAQKNAGNRQIDPGFLLALLNYSWPENVGELLDVMAKATAKAGPTGRLEPRHLELHDNTIIKHVIAEEEAEGHLYRRLAAIFELQGLTKGNGLNKRIAEVLNVSESTVSRKARDYGI